VLRSKGCATAARRRRTGVCRINGRRPTAL